MPSRFSSCPVVAAFAGAGLLLAAAPAVAVNGTQLGGYGVKNAAMGGASIALPLDAVAAANNPAGMAFVPATANLNLQLFKGQSSSDFLLPGNHLENRDTTSIPEGGINGRLGPTMTVGLSLAGQGAGADYRQPLLPVPGAANAKSSLKVAEFIPSLAWTPTPNLAIGAALNLAYETFEAQGVLVATPGGPVQLPAHGSQSATGAGLRLGVLWKITPVLSLGANLKTKTKMGRLKGYEDDLLASADGRIDIPGQYGVGVVWNASEQLTIAADYLRVQYRGMKLMQDPSGFYWRDQPIYRLGASYAVSEAWTLRAGLSRNRGQVEQTNVAQNLLAPSILDRAYTFGASWRMDPTSEFSVGYEHNPSTAVTGAGPSTGVSLASKVRIFMFGYQHNF
jgi:long-chain fatty acid transport protein